MSPVCHVGPFDTALHNDNSREFVVIFEKQPFCLTTYPDFCPNHIPETAAHYVTGGSNVIH